MKIALILVALMSAVAIAPASAQLVPQTVTPPPIPQPPPPPPPSMAVPQVPKMDAPPQQPTTNAPGRRSFNDRVIDCLTDGNASRSTAADRAAYSRACANGT